MANTKKPPTQRASAYDAHYTKERLDSIRTVPHATAAFVGRTTTNESSCDDIGSFDFLSPLEQMSNTPSYQRDVIVSCMNAYYRIGLLRNVIDIMSNFGSQGIHIIHPNATKEKFYKYWFEKVNGKERSERFLNMLYKAGNVVIKRDVAKLNKKDLDDFKRTVANTSPDVTYRRLPKVGKNEIPIKYRILNPWLLETVGGDLAPFLDEKELVLRIPSFLITMVKTPNTKTEEEMINDLPPFIRDAIKRGDRYIDMDNDKIVMYHYMKDDHMTWAYPMAFSILDDLMLYQSHKKADAAALRGIISHIRLWKLGDKDKGIIPGPAAFERLQSALSSNAHGSTMDLIWDDAIELVETATEGYKFLGSDKYQPALTAIYAGLGIPASLTGGTQEGGGFTNNAISLKTLIERLQYGRDLLIDFWRNEIRLVKEAIGDKQDAQIMFDNMNLYEDANEKMIWLQLLDRNVVSMASMQERFGLVPEIENQRMKRESIKRGADKMPAKAGPFHNDALHSNNANLAGLNQGTLSPSEAGAKKRPKPKGEKTLLQHQKEMAAVATEGGGEGSNPAKPKGQPQQGRPKTSKDTTKRKKKTVKPSAKADNGVE